MTDRKFSGVMEMRLPQNILQSEGQSRYVVIEPNYLYEGEEKKNNGIRRLNRQEPPVFLAFQTFQMNTKKIKYIYTYLIDNVDYDLDAPDNQNIYSALVGKRSVLCRLCKKAAVSAATTGYLLYLCNRTDYRSKWRHRRPCMEYCSVQWSVLCRCNLGEIRFFSRRR